MMRFFLPAFVFLRFLLLTSTLSSQVKFIGKSLDSLGIKDGVSVSAWLDYNNDGLPDVLARYFFEPKVRLFQNLGNSTFQDVTEKVGININHSTSGMAVGDFNADGWQDIVILDRKSIIPGTTKVYKNMGGAYFVDIAEGTSLAVSGDGESAAFADFDGDGDQDLIMLYYERNTITNEDGYGSPKLFRNDGNDVFVDVTISAGIIPNRTYNLTFPIINGEGLIVADLDEDGDLDMHYAGHTFRNDGNLHFYDVPFSESNLPAVFDEGCGLFDYDNDGIFDIVKNINSNYETYIYKGIGSLYYYRVYDFLLPVAPTYKWGLQMIDVDADGFTDLSLSAGAGDSIIGNSTILRNIGDGTFESLDTLVSPVFTTDSTQVENGSWADIDQDGDLDLFGGSIHSIYINQYNNPNYADVIAANQNGVLNQHGSCIRMHTAGSLSPPYQMLNMGFSNGFLSFGNYVAKFGINPNKSYDVSVSFPSVGGTPLVVDKNINSVLGGIHTEGMINSISGRTIKVKRNGVVIIGNTTFFPENAMIPTLFFPYQNTIINGSDSVSLYWTWEGNHTGNSVSYDVEVSNSSDFSNSNLSLTNLTTDSVTIKMTEPGLFFWRVKSIIDGLTYPWSDIFQFRVNRAPQFITENLPDAKEDSAYIMSLIAIDLDSLMFHDVVRYQIQSAPSWLEMDTVSGVLSGVPDGSAVGESILTIQAHDQWGGVTYRSYTLRVIHTNHSPVFISTPDTIAKVDSLYRFQIYAFDKDSLLFGDTVRYRFTIQPNWMMLDSLTGIITGTPSAIDIGESNVELLALDGRGGSASQGWKVKVNRVFRPPTAVIMVIPVPGDTLVLFKEPVNFMLKWIPSHDPDLIDTLLYSLRIHGTGFDTIISGLRDTMVVLSDRYLSANTIYTWSVSVFDGVFEVFPADTFSFQTTHRFSNATYNEYPKTYALFQNYPNPFNSVTTLRFQIPEESEVTIDLYNILGQKVQRLFREKLPARYYEIDWKADGPASGVYIVTMRANSLESKKSYFKARKIVFLK